jgi:hypothetical protein
VGPAQFRKAGWEGKGKEGMRRLGVPGVCSSPTKGQAKPRRGAPLAEQSPRGRRPRAHKATTEEREKRW